MIVLTSATRFFSTVLYCGVSRSMAKTISDCIAAMYTLLEQEVCFSNCHIWLGSYSTPENYTPICTSVKIIS